MAFWWVNQGQTYAQELAGGYLWSPKRAKNGSRRSHYDAMADAEVDDLVVHYVSKPFGAVVSASVVGAPARSHAQPAELQHTRMWKGSAPRVAGACHLRRGCAACTEVRRHRNRSDRATVHTERSSHQGYLYPLSDGFGERLLSRLDPVDVDRSSTLLAETHGDQDPETVPLEEGRRLTFDQVVTLGRRAAVRAEWSLVARLVADFGLEQTRRRYPLANGTELSADLRVEDTELLVEAKASAGRAAVRQAIGQLYDYADKEPDPVTKMLVVPERPTDDLLDVLRSADIRAVWLTDDVWDGDVDDSLWGMPNRDM